MQPVRSLEQSERIVYFTMHKKPPTYNFVHIFLCTCGKACLLQACFWSCFFVQNADGEIDSRYKIDEDRGTNDMPFWMGNLGTAPLLPWINVFSRLCENFKIQFVQASYCKSYLKTVVPKKVIVVVGGNERIGKVVDNWKHDGPNPISN